jgi:hypothetical protein
VSPHDEPKPIEIVITPSEAQYRQLCRDLEVLRRDGAESNTAAILDAVRSVARRKYDAAANVNAPATRERPGAGARR